MIILSILIAAAIIYFLHMTVEVAFAVLACLLLLIICIIKRRKRT